MPSRCLLVPTLLLLLPASVEARQRPADHGTIVIVMGADPSTPVPTMLGAKANNDVSDLLFLRLARPGLSLTTTDEKSYEPELAKSWSRRDSLTLVFELDPRARWHDGVPVTARDVVWSFDRMRDPAADPDRTLLLRHLVSATAETEHRVVLKFRRAYPEQFFDATFHVQPLPAHLVDTLTPARFPASAFVQNPVGNGPYRWVRREPGRQVELAADPAFFLGRPKLDRVVILIARDPDAQMNLMLDGTADMLEAVPPVSGPPRLARNPTIRTIAEPSFAVLFLLLNQRAYGDKSRPHPVLADRDVRRALSMSLDRSPILRSAFGAYGQVAYAPAAQGHWTFGLVPRHPGHDPAGARALLDRRGWIDRDGDGVREKDGVPLSLRLNVPASSGVRLLIAPQVQEQLRGIGARIEIVRLEGSVWAGRRGRGEFDIDFSSTLMDPTPAGIVQSWTCAGRTGSNVAQYCSPAVDSLIDAAISSSRDVERNWRAAYAAVQQDAPAIWLVSPTILFGIHSRYRGVTLRRESFYATLWRWSVDPSRRIARDGAGPPAR